MSVTLKTAAVMLALAIALGAGGGMAQTRELRIVSGGPMESTFGEILPAYEAASKTRLIVRYQAMGPLLKELESGAAADVVVLSAEAEPVTTI